MSDGRFQIKLPDALPQIVARYTKDDEQALLATVRYNRLIDVFLRVSAYHLQGHLPTTVSGIAQIETDDLYVAVRNSGQQFIVPVQAKTGNDQIGIVQVKQDPALCQHAFPELTPRPVAVQFIKDADGTAIVMFELTTVGDEGAGRGRKALSRLPTSRPLNSLRWQHSRPEAAHSFGVRPSPNA